MEYTILHIELCRNGSRVSEEGVGRTDLLTQYGLNALVGKHSRIKGKRSMKRVFVMLLATIILLGCVKENKTKNAQMYVNGTLVDEELVSFEQDTVLVPVIKLFESIGYSVKWDDDHIAEIYTDKLHLRLNLQEQTLVNVRFDEWNRFTLKPGDTEEDFIYKEIDHELLVCAEYIMSAFELLYIDLELSVDFDGKKVYITSDGVYHAPYWIVP